MRGWRTRSRRPSRTFRPEFPVRPGAAGATSISAADLPGQAARAGVAAGTDGDGVNVKGHARLFERRHPGGSARSWSAWSARAGPAPPSGRRRGRGCPGRASPRRSCGQSRRMPNGKVGLICSSPGSRACVPRANVQAAGAEDPRGLSGFWTIMNFAVESLRRRVLRRVRATYDFPTIR